MSTRLLNQLFENDEFLVDEASVGYIVRDIINMNWWNTCNYLLGYQNNKRVSLPHPSYEMKLTATVLKEFYRHHQESIKNTSLLEKELENYINGTKKSLRQLKLFSMKYRKNDSQYYYKDGNSTWLDCTSRATYAWKYVSQNGYIDFDGVCRVENGNNILKHCNDTTAYPHKKNLLKLFDSGLNSVKSEIFSQKHIQETVEEWVDKLNIKVISSREWLYKLISHVKTDPYKNFEKFLFKEGKLTGNNEALYGYKTTASINSAGNASCASYASDASRASSAGHASRASDASSASHASGASFTSHASRASRESNASNASNVSSASDASYASRASVISEKGSSNITCWYDSPYSLGKLDTLDHPPVFMKNKYGIAGHWKINKDLVDSCEIGFIDPFCGHGETPLYAKKVGKNFVGIEINPDSMNGYLLPYVQNAVNRNGDPKVKVELRLGDSAIFQPDLVGMFDLCYTSPPYFNFEDYGFHNKVIQECIDYDEYHQRVTVPVFSNIHKYLIDGGTLAIQTEKNKTLKKKWIEVISNLGFKLIDDTVTGQEKIKYSKMSKRDQTLLIFKKV